MRLYIPKAQICMLFGPDAHRIDMLAYRDTEVKVMFARKLEIPPANIGLKLDDDSHKQVQLSVVLGLTTTREQAFQAISSELIGILRGGDGTLADAWQYIGSEDRQTHGPFKLHQLDKWQQRFPPTHLTSHQHSGVLVPLHFIVDAHAVGPFQAAFTQLATPRRHLSKLNTINIPPRVDNTPSTNAESPVGMMSVGSPQSSSFQSARTTDATGARPSSTSGAAAAVAQQSDA